jgi:hypothetical protein
MVNQHRMRADGGHSRVPVRRTLRLNNLRQIEGFTEAIQILG